MTTTAIVVHDLSKSFGAHRVLEGLSFTVLTGTVCALLGTNGAGKTTTMSILTTLLQPDSGTARVAGHDVTAEPATVRQAISVSGQNVTVDPILTGLENLVLIARLRHVHAPKHVATDLIERFGLIGAATKPTATYSGGMKRRLDLAMSLIGDPQIIFLDEPTTGLDPAGRREVWDTVSALAATGTTILLTTQHMEEAAHLADTIAVLAGGRIKASGSHDDILDAAGAADLEAAFLTLTGPGGPS
ncbi:MAG: ABC transporter ATP-binding protein [Candidatus Nanopelagicales bacterium]